jgi:hypothetical protein
VGVGGISGTDDEDLSQGMAFTIGVGLRVSPHLHLMLNSDYTSFARYQPDPDLSQQQSSLTLGARWAPLDFAVDDGIAVIDLTNVYLRGGLGVAHLIRIPFGSFNLFRVEQGTWGGAVTGAVGWTALRWQGGALGVEASDSLAIYGDGTRQNFGVTLFGQLERF